MGDMLEPANAVAPARPYGTLALKSSRFIALARCDASRGPRRRVTTDHNKVNRGPLGPHAPNVARNFSRGLRWKDPKWNRALPGHLTRNALAPRPDQALDMT